MSRPSQREHVKSFENAYLNEWRQGVTPHHRIVLRMSPFFKDRGIKTILDIGCGHGHILTHLSEDGFEVTGTEIVPSLLSGPLKNKKVIPWGVADLDKLDESFDLVLMTDLLDHLRDVEDVDTALEQADRLANKAIIVTIGGYSNMRTIDEPMTWWADKISGRIGLGVLKMSIKSDVHGFSFWRKKK